jgi:uncharacterized protein YqcC (DUF446 family)
MSVVHVELRSLLVQLEAELRSNNLWAQTAPAVAALGSTQPFACDTLQFNEWLQFIFMPRLLSLLERRAPLPQQCDISPMAELFFQGMGCDSKRLLTLIGTIDRLITEAN